jgi:DNA-binding transcriptional LysR family regulator
MKLQQIRYFVEAVNCGSINKAAERLLVAQPSLSNALRDLETEIGHVLFTRTSKGVLLTADGEDFYVMHARFLIRSTFWSSGG